MEKGDTCLGQNNVWWENQHVRGHFVIFNIKVRIFFLIIEYMYERKQCPYPKFFYVKYLNTPKILEVVLVCGRGLIRQITSQVLIRKFQSDWFEIIFLGKAETALVRLAIKFWFGDMA